MRLLLLLLLVLLLPPLILHFLLWDLPPRRFTPLLLPAPLSILSLPLPPLLPPLLRLPVLPFLPIPRPALISGLLRGRAQDLDDLHGIPPAGGFAGRGFVRRGGIVALRVRFGGFQFEEGGCFLFPFQLQRAVPGGGRQLLPRRRGQLILDLVFSWNETMILTVLKSRNM